MKIRIRENSLRVRLTRGEVERLAGGERIAQSTRFGPGNELLSSIAPSSAATTPIARFEGGHISLIVPRAIVEKWARGQEIGIEAEQPIDGEKPLRLLIEKDFQCLHCDAEGIEDAYPNPRKTAIAVKDETPAGR